MKTKATMKNGRKKKVVNDNPVGFALPNNGMPEKEQEKPTLKNKGAMLGQR